MRKRSIPASTSTGHTTSRNAVARTSVPSDALGATFFAAKATAKWPMNTSSSLPEQRLLEALLRRVVAQPDLEQCAIEILARDGLAPGLAVQHYAGSRSRQPVERDQVPFLRRLQRVHDGDELAHPLAERFPLRGGGVVSDAELERLGQLLGGEVAHQAHRHALR